LGVLSDTEAHDPQPAVRASPSEGETAMAKKKADSGVYRVTEVIGTSTISWEDAASSAVKAASQSLRDLRIAEIGKLDMKVEDGKVVHTQTKAEFGFGEFSF
jgi:hypothetical protein